MKWPGWFIASNASRRARSDARVVHAANRRWRAVRAWHRGRRRLACRAVEVVHAGAHLRAAAQIGVTLRAGVAAVRPRDTPWTRRRTREPFTWNARAFVNHRRAAGRRLAAVLERTCVTTVELRADGCDDRRTDTTRDAANVEHAPAVRVRRSGADTGAHAAQRRRQHRAALAAAARATRRRAQRALERRAAGRRGPAQPAARGVGHVDQAIAVIVFSVRARLTRAGVHGGIERGAVASGNALALLRQVAVPIDVDAGRRFAARLRARARDAHLPGLHALRAGRTGLRRRTPVCARRERAAVVAELRDPTLRVGASQAATGAAANRSTRRAAT